VPSGPGKKGKSLKVARPQSQRGRERGNPKKGEEGIAPISNNKEEKEMVYTQLTREKGGGCQNGMARAYSGRKRPRSVNLGLAYCTKRKGEYGVWPHVSNR